MSWLSKDLEDLEEIQSNYCSATDCSECVFNIEKTTPCLEEVTKSFRFTFDMIEKHKRRLEEYV